MNSSAPRLIRCLQSLSFTCWIEQSEQINFEFLYGIDLDRDRFHDLPGFQIQRIAMHLNPNSDANSEARSTTGSLERAEKLSPVKLHIAQYIVAMILAVLLVGLWRLQIVGAD